MAIGSGYTFPVIDGRVTTLRDFALLCARAFLHRASDLPLDAPMPERFEPLNHQLEWQREAEKRLTELLAMSPSDVRIAYDAAMASARSYDEKAATDHAESLARLMAMVTAVSDWTPPSGMDALKTFMLTQLRQTLDYQGTPVSAANRLPIIAITWHANEIAKARKDAARHAAEYVKELDRVKVENDFLAALRASLPSD